MLTHGLYLIRRKSTTLGALIDHYGVLDYGNVSGFSDVNQDQPLIFHNVYPKPIVQKYQDTISDGDWEIIEQSSDVQGAQKRILMAFRQGGYNLLFNNCEHFARFVVSKDRKSVQLRTAVILVLIGAGLYYLFRKSND